ncbi:MAG: sulfur relay protein DsrC [Bacteroidetes bacterium GWE2_40_63]|nr:MAG: sulfur relay protein DsrC [Bacteroidetes bacterium GWA2_40_14]OFX65483.1 MAG: sulfur relay protein DsrC [Bacteroidetes bacterium GWC2_40_13]OFX71226.1 MAG: sulfur relay protein DsrC [Bacteroidetes bacterium GWD2_40_43]OFX90285.1 MAG: sulfur relay protein DsrC [Bacteroidetes bacterium GWE2_40_63]OFY22123.1 MAG: sulfur relay protein DsrC [Bacteroidetes bacterium GWF2_40_13]OFZ27767.1 MAG: sulfur relay protein DsrC [Bacteroidetes bacterium RIFOXYC2_FULL_40_12]HBO76199.1 sulfur relay prot
MEKIIAGKIINMTEDGYLIKSSEWTIDVARELAHEEGLLLLPEHFRVIEFLRHLHTSNQNITLRQISKSNVADIKTLYELFPGAPLKKAARIAGIPKPTSCV